MAELVDVARGEIATAVSASSNDSRTCLDPDAPAPKITGAYERGPTTVPVR